MISDTKNGVNLYVVEPFEYNTLEKECGKCKHFGTQPVFSPSGICIKHKFSCGCGGVFVCDDFER